MSSSARGLTEPRVLAGAKRRLFPDVGAESGRYAVTDTQFAVDSWVAGERVDPAVRASLAPFNHVQVGSGYPDIVGVTGLDEELLSVDRVGDEPPLVVVEAKGYASGGRVDVARGVVQAHDRLGEANAAFVAAPVAAVRGSPEARALARELNVGVLGVREDGSVAVLERSRVVGHRSTSETTAIRFQASAQGVADKSFGLNHPKNYLGYALAVAHDAGTESVVDERVVGAVEAAKQGASFLGLVADEPVGARLTSLGREVVRFAVDAYGSVDEALVAFDDWKRSRQRFCELAPQWGLVTRRVMWDYRATPLLVESLQTMFDDGERDPSLVDLVVSLHERHPSFAIELFVRGTEDARSRVLDDEGVLQRAALRDGHVYHSPTVFQLKAMLYHAGVVAERGAEPSNLEPESDSWRLRTPLSVNAPY